MEENNLNTLIFETLNKISILDSSKVSMFPTDDIYGHPPFLRFRFHLRDQDGLIIILKKIIADFQGNLTWEILTVNNSRNNLLLPSIFEEYSNSRNFYNKDFYIKTLGESNYKKLIDNAVSDIPNLASEIEKIQY